MLRKIISIKNVGRFLAYNASGDVGLKHYDLVFAENGRGKTTLCAILRSLHTGDPAYVLGRTTLGSGDAPEIKILFDGALATFENGDWNTTFPDLAIFDSTFISENVYSGDAVELSHKRNLYKVIIGKAGVDLAREIEKLDAASRDQSTAIREKRAVVQALVPRGFTVEQFVALEPDAAIVVKIAEKEKELEAVKQADQIKSRAGLSELPLPAFPAGFMELIEKTLEGISADAERQLTMQIEKHSMHDRGESWLSEGLHYVTENACPFCDQSLTGVELIDAYRAYFSDAYNALRSEITDLRQLIATTLSDREIARIERAIDQNTASVEFWSRFSSIAPPVVAEVEAIGDTLRSLRQAAITILDQKAGAPLEAVVPDSAFSTAHKAYLDQQNEIAIYNIAVRVANDLITAKRAATAASDVKTVEFALLRLKAIQKRNDPDGTVACQEYQSALSKKTRLEEEKAAAKEKLDNHTKAVINQYEKSINRLLDEFQAGFRITETEHGYPGGVASCGYQILINETPVELGDSTTPLDRPSFKNTLSSGDKSTLALAFFLAQLEHDSERASKIIVFDDPFNSQDSFRKDCTVQNIKKCGETSAQVIVLSHDQSFLKRVWDRLAPQATERKCLQLARIGVRNTTISEWDIEQATQARFIADRNALADYYNTGAGNPRDIVNKIRPVLEAYSKNLYPSEFAADMLGTVIGKIRTTGASHAMFPVMEELDALNEYTRRYHHGENPNAATEPINDTELQGFVKKTLAIIGCC